MYERDEQPRILAIDDDPIALEVLKLQLEGMSILTATSGEDGLELARTFRVDLILLDVVMPGIDGFEVLRRLRAHAATATTPVLLLTVLSEREHIARGFECGADDYLVKPIESWELLARIRAQVERHRLRRAVARHQKQEALQRIVSGLSHEINNPLFVIRGFTELLGGQVDRASRPHVDRILEATDRVSTLVRGIGEAAARTDPLPLAACGEVSTERWSRPASTGT